MTYVIETDGALRRVLANAGVLLGGRMASGIMGIAAMALTARALGVTEFGILVLIQAFAQFLGDTVKFKSWQLVLHYGTRPLAEGRRADFQRVVRFSIVLDLMGSSLGVAAGVIAMLWFAPLVGLPDENSVPAALFMLSVAFMVSATPTGLLRLFDRFDVLARQIALMALVRLIGSAIAYAMDASMNVFLFFWGISTVAGYAYMTWKVSSELDRRGLLRNFPWDGGLTATMPGAWRFAWSTNLSATLDVSFTHVITLVIGGLIGPAQAALWRVGRQVSGAIAKPARLLTSSLYPELSKMHASGLGYSAVMWRLAGHIALLAGALGIGLLILTMGAGEWLLSVVMGPEFGPAAYLMNWQIAAAVIGLFALPLEPMLVAFGLAHVALRVRLVVCILYLLAVGPIVSHFGATGAAVSLVGASLAMALGMLWAVLYQPCEPATMKTSNVELSEREFEARL